jgi:hypothetical protein
MSTEWFPDDEMYIIIAELFGSEASIGCNDGAMMNSTLVNEC